MPAAWSSQPRSDFKAMDETSVACVLAPLVVFGTKGEISQGGRTDEAEHKGWERVEEGYMPAASPESNTRSSASCRKRAERPRRKYGRSAKTTARVIMTTLARSRGISFLGNTFASFGRLGVVRWRGVAGDGTNGANIVELGRASRCPGSCIPSAPHRASRNEKSTRRTRLNSTARSYHAPRAPHSPASTNERLRGGEPSPAPPPTLREHLHSPLDVRKTARPNTTYSTLLRVCIRVHPPARPTPAPGAPHPPARKTERLGGDLGTPAASSQRAFAS
ncbi:hypothetical protein C8F04DRAFT_1235072 [Mycena alexandri]|uniref:Uncharacterized protein n=1 Tax=Mycena alexandri TaxID=1745969 RepID=A0AAD6SS59_9AGAR|nr:hypothetical protein C8F04DRAFT_1235072 [Mycena alexandri]